MDHWQPSSHYRLRYDAFRSGGEKSRMKSTVNNQMVPGEMVAEYKVSRLVVILAALLTVFFAAMSILGIIALTTSVISGDYEFISQFALVILGLIVVTGVAYLFLRSSRRTRLQVFRDKLINQTAFGSREFSFETVAQMQVVMGGFHLIGKSRSPFKPNLQILDQNSGQQRFICPFLVSDFRIFDGAVSAWEAHRQSGQAQRAT